MPLSVWNPFLTLWIISRWALPRLKCTWSDWIIQCQSHRMSRTMKNLLYSQVFWRGLFSSYSGSKLGGVYFCLKLFNWKSLEDIDGTYECSCDSGYVLGSDGHSCQDIEECSVDNGGCDHTCHEELGSFYCSCRDGYELASDNKGCVDVNECLLDVHGCSDKCLNHEGKINLSNVKKASLSPPKVATSVPVGDTRNFQRTKGHVLILMRFVHSLFYFQYIIDEIWPCQTPPVSE